MTRLLLPCLIAALCGAFACAGAQLAGEDPGDGGAALEAILDSLRSEPDTLFHWDTSVPSHWAPRTDSVWIPQAGEEGWRGGSGKLDVGALPLGSYSKANGVMVGARLGFEARFAGDVLWGGGVRRALDSGRWEGFGVAGLFSRDAGSLGLPRGSGVRLTGGARGSPGGPLGRRGGLLVEPGWGAVIAWSRGAVPFFSNRPYATSAAGLIAGLDHQDYLNRREGSVGFLWRPSRTVQGELLFVRREDEPLSAGARGLLRLDEDIMERNLRAEEMIANGVILSWTAGQSREMLVPEVAATVRLGFWGGALGGDREFYTAGGEARKFFPAPLRSKVRTEAWLGFSGGDPPLQEMTDLGGESSLRGYPPASFVGPAAFLIHADYILGVDIFRLARIPLLGRLKLQPAAFFDAGAVWGDEPWRRTGDLTVPNAGDWRFDAGVGIQRHLGLTGIISTIRMDAAWRMDRDRDRLRLNVLLAP